MFARISAQAYARRKIFQVANAQLNIKAKHHLPGSAPKLHEKVHNAALIYLFSLTCKSWNYSPFQVDWVANELKHSLDNNIRNKTGRPEFVLSNEVTLDHSAMIFPVVSRFSGKKFHTLTQQIWTKLSALCHNAFNAESWLCMCTIQDARNADIRTTTWNNGVLHRVGESFSDFTISGNLLTKDHLVPSLCFDRVL